MEFRRFMPIVFALVVVLLGGCEEKPEPVGRATLGYYKGDTSALAILAAEKGFYAEQGLQVEMVPFAAGKLAADALMEGAVDYATSADFVFAHAVAGGEEVVTLASMARANVNYLVARPDAGIEKVEDLAGAKVGLTKGSQAEFYLARMLQARGLSVADVEVVDMKPQALADALVQGKLDAVLFWEPHVTRVKERLGGDAVSWPAQGGQDFYWLLLARPGAYDERVARAMLAALLQAARWMQNHPEEATQVLARHVDKPQELVARMLRMQDFRVGLSQGLILALEDETRWILGENGGQMPNYLEYIDTAPLHEVRPGAVTMVH